MMRVLRFLAVFAILVGAYFSVSAGRKLQSLQNENRSLKSQVGHLQVDDPGKVYISAVPSKLQPEGVDQGIQHSWTFRVYYPPKFPVIEVSHSGSISADSPRSSGSSSTSTSHQSGQAESKLELITISLGKVEGGWEMHHITNSSSGISSAHFDLDVNDPDSAVIDPLVRPGEAAKSFEADQAICLIRVRGKEPVKRRNAREDDVPLFPGFYFYIVPKAAEPQFQAAVRGESLAPGS